MTQIQTVLFSIGQVVRHRDGAFRGVIMDVDPVYDGPAAQTGRVNPEQPFYRVYAMGEDRGFVAYVAEAALEADDSVLTRADECRWFAIDADGHHAPLDMGLH